MSTRSTTTHTVPLPATPFIGRTTELAEMTDLIADPACRLLTLVGPGGIGKTRLALEVATRCTEFVNGAAFVPLQPVQSPGVLASTIADVLQFALAGAEEPRVQLLNYLRGKQLLLILDNFEHLLEGVELLSAILAAAPNVKLLVTSREVLNLREEWIYPVHGLEVPPGARMGDIAHYSAVQLFVERARRVRRDFALEHDTANVARICRLVEGMPLAIELAATWIRTLPCAAIVSEIESNLAFLSTRMRNIPEHHRSMQATFDQSWQLLTAEEQQVFCRLAVFRGGFTLAAAHAVYGDPGAALSGRQPHAPNVVRAPSSQLHVLSALVDKSLLRSDPDGRYHLHELLRQYAEARLRETPEEWTRACDRHCAYYTGFLAEREAGMIGGRQREAAREIAADLENIRAAWEWAIERRDVAALRTSEHAFELFHEFRCRYREGYDLFERAAQMLQDTEPTQATQITLAMIRAAQGWFSIRFGRHTQAAALFAQAEDLFNRLQVPPLPGQGTDPLLGRAILALIEGAYAEAGRLGEELVRRAEAQKHISNLPYAWYVLTNAALAQGQYQAAQHYARQAYAAVQASQDHWFMAYCLNELGNVALALNDYAAARQHYQASYTLREEFDDPQGMALALNLLGKVALVQQDYSEARRLYQESLAIYHDVGDRGGIATALHGLGRVRCAEGNFQEARRSFRQALEIAAEIRFTPLILTIFVSVAEMLHQAGQPEWSVTLLVLILRHPASDREASDRAHTLIEHYERQMPPDALIAATRSGQTAALDEVVARLVQELATPSMVPGDANTATPTTPDRPAQPLVEPLTEREREVLELIARGLSNQQIADTLILSVGTIKWYARQIYGKLGVQTRTQAIARARELDLLA